MMSDNNNRILPSLTHKAVAYASFVIAVYFNIRYVVGLHSHLDNDHTFHVANTPFTANVFFIVAYWLLLYVLQLTFLVQFYRPESAIIERSKDIGWHFTLFNILQIIWSWLFARGHFFWSEVTLIVNFFNLLALYVSHKPYAVTPVSRWAQIHVPTTAMPFSWIFYAIFWNGAVLFHAKGLAARIVANVLIWDFLIVPAMFLVLYKDWAVGLSSSYLMWGLGVGQFFVKVFALQWIFAFIIASLLFVGSLLMAVAPRPVISESEAPALPNERAPLLSGGV